MPLMTDLLERASSRQGPELTEYYGSPNFGDITHAVTLGTRSAAFLQQSADD